MNCIKDATNERDSSCVWMDEHSPMVECCLGRRTEQVRMKTHSQSSGGGRAEHAGPLHTPSSRLGRRYDTVDCVSDGIHAAVWLSPVEPTLTQVPRTSVGLGL